MSKKQDRQGVRTAQDLERKYKLGEYGKLIKELRKEVRTVKENSSSDNTTSEVYTTTVSVFLEPGKEEATTTKQHVSAGTYDELYDFNEDGEITAVDALMVEKAASGLMSLANWSGAVKSDVVVTIDMSSPEKIVSAKGTNMWGREVELTSSELIADMLLDIDFIKSNLGSETSIDVQNSINEINEKVIQLEEKINSISADDSSVTNEDISNLQSEIDDIKILVNMLDDTVGIHGDNFYNINTQIQSVKDSINVLEERVNPNTIEISAIKVINENQDEIINKLKTKYILDHGTSGIWRWEKWSDGTVRCWGTQAVASATYYASGIADTYYSNYTANFPTELFTSSPTHISIMPITETDEFAFVSVKNLSKDSVSWKTMLMTVTGAGSHSVGFYIEVTGDGALG